jgi:hypothetical protein
MTRKYLSIPPLNGQIYVVAVKDHSEDIGEVIIAGDPSGLKSLGMVLIAMSEIDQSQIDSLPDDESEHIHLNPGRHIGIGKLATHRLIISRLDTKSGGLKDYYKSNLPSQRAVKEIRNYKKNT